MKLRTLPLLAAAATFGFAPPATAQLPDAQSILDRYEDATGASGNPYDGISSIRTRMNMSNPAMGMSMNMQVDVVLPDRFVMRMEIPGMGEVRSGYDGEVGWSMNPMTGPQLLAGAELESMRAQATDLASPGLSDNLESAETTGESDVDGTPCHLVQMRMKTGEEALACFDAESGLLLRQTIQQGEMEVESFFEEYRTFGPVHIPSRIVVRAGGQEQIITIDSIDYDAVDPAAMQLPAEIQALVDKQ